MGLAVDILFWNGSHSHCPCVVLVEIGVDLAGSAEKAEGPGGEPVMLVCEWVLSTGAHS